MSPEFLYKEKILPRGNDITEFVSEMREVESNAREFWAKLQWFSDDGNSMAYVAPKYERNTINFNLKTIAFNSKNSRGTIIHELTHLRQQSVTWDAYHPPGFEKLSQAWKNNIYKHAGLPEMAVRDILEWFVEGSTAKKEGVDKNCAYTYFQVPAVKKLDKMVQERTWVSLIACYVEMSRASMARFESAILETNNQIMAEEGFVKKWRRPTVKQLKQAHAIAKNKATSGEIFEDSDKTWNILRNTPAPIVVVIEEKRAKVANILDQIHEKEVIPENIFEEELVNTGTTFELRNKTADIVDWVMRNTAAESHELPLAA
jgi:hypothetical protein